MTSIESILKKVVFIDDNTATNQLHRMLANSMNLAHDLEFYETAEEAIRKYGNPNYNGTFPNIFFVDIGLPMMSGHELATALRRLPGFKENNSAICFLTASKDIRDVVTADNNDFDHYYWKPLDKRKMARVLREVFNIKVS